MVTTLVNPNLWRAIAAKMSDCKWKDTLLALKALESQLKCSICNEIMYDVSTLSTCDHSFCKNCIKNVLQVCSQCPECGQPAWMKHLNANPQLFNIIRNVAKIEELISNSERCLNTTKHLILSRCKCKPLQSSTFKSLNDNCRKRRLSAQIDFESDESEYSNSQPAVHLDLNSSGTDYAIEQIRKVATITARLNFEFKKLETDRPNQDMELGVSKKQCRASLFTRKKTLHESTINIFETDASRSSYAKVHSKIFSKNYKGETLLHIAAIKNDDRILDYINAGADVNAKDYAGWTPLHEACNHGHTKAANTLLNNGALVNNPGFDNDTPLHDAVANGHHNIVALLLRYGADINTRNSHGLSPKDMSKSEKMTLLLEKAISLQNEQKVRCVPFPKSSSKYSEIILVGTGLFEHQKIILQELTNTLKATLVSSYSDAVTHIITNSDNEGACSRTFKFLCGIASGKWILKFDWVLECMSELRWINEYSYEVFDVLVGKQIVHTAACKKSRENAQQKMPGLFNGCSFYLSGTYSPPNPTKEEVIQLIRLAGGSILSKPPRSDVETCPIHANFKFLYNMFVVSNCNTDELPTRLVQFTEQKSKAALISPMWILDCLTCFELLEIN